MLQAKIFTHEQEKELNAFLSSASIYHTETNPGVRVLETHIVVWYNPAPGSLDKIIAAQTLESAIKSLKDNLVQYEMDLRQFSWRIAEKETRADELAADIAEMTSRIDALGKKAESRDAVKVLEQKRRDAREELEGAGEGKGRTTGVLEQIDNSGENTRITLKKIEDTKKDILAAQQLVADIKSGTFEIFGN